MSVVNQTRFGKIERGTTSRFSGHVIVEVPYISWPAGNTTDLDYVRDFAERILAMVDEVKGGCEPQTVLMAQEIENDSAWLDGWNEDAPDTLRDNLSEAGFGDFGPM